MAIQEAVLESEERTGTRLVNRRAGTEPLVFHAQGYHTYKPVWPKIREWCFAKPPQRLGPRPRVTVITCNNGHEAMGLFEKSVERLGIPIHVAGREFPQWSNATHKPLAILNALAMIKTPYVLYADSRDAILVGDPEILVDRLEGEFAAELVFGACQLSWPAVKEFTAYELSLPDAKSSEYRHLNGGMWIGTLATARELFTAVRDTPPSPSAPESEQGKIRAIFPRYFPRVSLDYKCQLFNNVGFVFEDVFEIV
jgi:hypothetical protein